MARVVPVLPTSQPKHLKVPLFHRRNFVSNAGFRKTYEHSAEASINALTSELYSFNTRVFVCLCFSLILEQGGPSKNAEDLESALELRKEMR